MTEFSYIADDIVGTRHRPDPGIETWELSGWKIW